MTEPVNVAGFLERQALARPEHDAIVWVDGGKPSRGVRYGRWTYGEFEAKVERLAAGFQAEGLRPGDRAMVFVPMSADLYLVLLGLWRAGGVAVFLDPWSPPGLMAEVCASMAPSWFIGLPAAFLFLWRHAALRRIPHKVTTRPFWFGPRLTLAKLMATGDRLPACAPRQPEDPALVTFTSGTTGRPKGANRTHAFLTAQHAALEKTLTTVADDIDLSHFPIFVLNSLAAGRTAVIPRMDFRRPAAADPAWLRAIINDLGVTRAIGSPAFFATLAAAWGPQGLACPSLRSALTGGGPVDPRLLTKLERVFPQAEVAIVYGSTEAEPISHIAAQEVIGETLDGTRRGRGRCVGVPVDEVRVQLADSVDGVGEILVAGDHVCREYLGDPEANQRYKVRDAEGVLWHRTGDLAWQDERGRLWLMGRTGEGVASATGPLYLSAIEAAVETVPGVARAAGIAAREPDGTDAVWLGWTAEPGPALAEPAIRALFASSGWPLGKVQLLAKLPTDPRHNTKIDRRRLAQVLGVEEGGRK